MYRLETFLKKYPDAAAVIRGSGNYPKIKGETMFYETNRGVLIVSHITGLPQNVDKCKNSIFAFHIHRGENCTGTAADPFLNVLTHYNPNNCPHPYHAGDMPPLFGNNGEAFSAFVTNRFTINEIIGKTVVIHSNPDDFTSQPAGNSGTKIACGEIRKWK